MKMPNIWRAGLYLRLSRDDETAGESASIENQRELLMDYAVRNGYAVAAEYVDDGYSGTNFDRPAFRRMLEEIEQGRINLVLVKDLSRLGRDYIQTGWYLEVVLPERGVRLIAVNDGIDTARGEADLAPFRNVVNEQYARDTSRKIRSSLQTKMRAGQYIGNFAPYGYRKDPADRNHLLPDEGAAGTVQRVFAWAAAGKTASEIACALNRSGTLPPSLYRCERFPALDPVQYTKSGIWTAAGVGRILGNIVYLGHVAQGKTSKISFKSDKTRENPQEEWTIVRNCHTPLVTQEVFDAAARQRNGRRKAPKGGFSNLFSGVAYCADCGRSMSAVGTRKKGSVANLTCAGYKQGGKQVCTNHFIAYEALYECVQQVLCRYTAISEEEKAQLLCRLEEWLRRESHAARQEDERQVLWRRLEQVKRIIGGLYADRATGQLSDANFYPLLTQYEGQSRAMMQRLSALERTEPQAEEQTRQAALRACLARCIECKALSRTMLDTLVERIEVGQGWYIKTEQGREKRQQLRLFLRFASAPIVLTLTG